EPFVLDRSSSYIGVLIDDLTTKGTPEPYRMFTSRVEYRLVIREDNADLRLAKAGYGCGLLKKKDYMRAEKKQNEIVKGINTLRSYRVKPTDTINKGLMRLGSAPINKSFTLEEILKRPQVDLENLKAISGLGPLIPEIALKQVEIEVKYSGFIERQYKEVERFRNLEKIRLPEGMDYALVNGLSREIREKLNKFKPMNLGQASRISGVTPAAVSILMVYLKKLNGQK
ncbi:MAG: tRNA uridine-5-carboxymethylaminomethyl(34) synthesis enzyme MnmG, partial [Candidatus Omnitrophica bacterium]|nr:tRNA uridine-5-carboxymethylaminomethyl(34) synthesis enzyme MnmG [Candidatus Omnitrophota bacterium]